MNLNTTNDSGREVSRRQAGALSGPQTLNFRPTVSGFSSPFQCRHLLCTQFLAFSLIALDQIRCQEAWQHAVEAGDDYRRENCIENLCTCYAVSQ